jgi:type II secretion system protein N
MVELKGYRKYAAYAAVFLAAFVLAFRQTFPAEAVRARLAAEAAAQGWQLKAADAGPAGLIGVRLTGVTAESREGVRVPVEELRTSLRILPLVLGRRGVDFDARLYGGRVRGVAEETRSSRRLAATVTGVNLAQAAAIQKLTGLDLAGTLAGSLDVTLDVREPARSRGSVDLRLEKGALMGGQIQLAAFGGALTLPRADLGSVVAQATVKDGKASFERLEAKGPDLELAGEGLAVTLQPRLAYSPLFGKARLKLADGFWQKSGTTALRGVAEAALAQARGRDGAYWFQIYGTVSSPQARAGGG